MILYILTIFLIYDKLFKKKLILYGENLNYVSANIVNCVKESITGYKDIKILNKEKYFINKLDNLSKKYVHYLSFQQLLQISPRYVLEFLFILFLVIIVFITIDHKNVFYILTLFGVASLRLILQLTSS